MSIEYDWDLSRQATERILHLPKSERTALFYFFDSIAANVGQESDEKFYDQFGQLHHIKTYGKRTITYSIDDPVCLVHFEAIEP